MFSEEDYSDSDYESSGGEISYVRKTSYETKPGGINAHAAAAIQAAINHRVQGNDSRYNGSFSTPSVFNNVTVNGIVPNDNNTNNNDDSNNKPVIPERTEEEKEARHLSAKLINRLLTRDAISRKTQQWHLLTIDEMDDMLESTLHFRFDNISVQEQLNQFPPHISSRLKTLRERRHSYRDRHRLDEKQLLTCDVFAINRIESTYLNGELYNTNIPENNNDIRTRYEHHLYTLPDWIYFQDVVIDYINTRYPFVSDLLNYVNYDVNIVNFSGLKLIAAGGAIFKALHFTEAADIDFFFVDEIKDRLARADTDPAVFDIYNRALVSIVSYLVDSWFNKGWNDPHQVPVAGINAANDDFGPLRENPRAFVTRNEFVTTVHLSDSRCEYKYQFIHRMYPSVESILGGFDLGPAMIAYTGRQIVATELGAWSAFSKTLIVDISRRSTSFEHRLKKYSRLCHIIFPGLPNTVTASEMASWKDSEEMYQMIMDTIDNYGYKVQTEEDKEKRKYDSWLKSHQVQNYNFKYGPVAIYHEEADEDSERPLDNFILIKKQTVHNRISEQELIDRITTMISSYGYQLQNPRQLQFINHNLLPNGDDKHNITILELANVLRKLAYSCGYDFRANSFYDYLERLQQINPSANEYRSRYYDESIDEKYPFLHYRSRYLTLPRMKVFLGVNNGTGYHEGSMIKVRNTRSYKKASTIEEYYQTKNKFHKKEFSKSDYDDNSMWPILLGEQNSTCLVNENLIGAVAVVYFINSRTKVGYIDYYGADNGKVKLARAEQLLLNSCVHIDPVKNLSARSIIEGTLLAGLTNANLGNVLQAFENKVQDTKEGRLVVNRYGGHVNRIKAHFAEFSTGILEQSMKDEDVDFEGNKIDRDKNIDRYRDDNDGHREYAPMLSDVSKAIIDDACPILMERIVRNEARVKQILNQGIKWITKNPGKQWTSSINPVVLDPRDWYGEQYKSFTIGNESLETTLRCLRKFTDSSWSILNNDIFEHLMVLILYNR